MTRRPSGSLSAVIHDSRIARVMNWMGRTGQSAWHDSAAVQFARAAWNRTGAWSPSERIRVWALAFTWAGVFHMAGSWALPGYVTSGLPMAWFAALTMLAASVAVCAEPAAVAWKHSATRRAIGPDENS